MPGKKIATRDLSFTSVKYAQETKFVMSPKSISNLTEIKILIRKQFKHVYLKELHDIYLLKLNDKSNDHFEFLKANCGVVDDFEKLNITNNIDNSDYYLNIICIKLDSPIDVAKTEKIKAIEDKNEKIKAIEDEIETIKKSVEYRMNLLETQITNIKIDKYTNNELERLQQQKLLLEEKIKNYKGPTTRNLLPFDLYRERLKEPFMLETLEKIYQNIIDQLLDRIPLLCNILKKSDMKDKTIIFLLFFNTFHICNSESIT